MPDDPMYTAALAVLDQDRVRRREINRRLINVAKRQLAAGMSTDEVWVTNFQCAIAASEMGASRRRRKASPSSAAIGASAAITSCADSTSAAPSRIRR
jgi:hypothetical protein